MRFLLYHRRSAPTGRLLAEELGIESGTEMPDERYEYLLRWGSRTRVRYRPSVKTINKLSAIRQCTDKFNSLNVLDSSGLQVPPYSRNWRNLNFPILGRSNSHMGGRDIRLILQSRDIRIEGEHDYYTQYIPKKREYRVHVIDGRIIRIFQKTINPDEEEYDPIRCNNAGSWTHREPSECHPGIYQSIAAVNCLGLDFGAVDCIVGEEDNEMYFLEVNTAPGLTDSSTLPLYINEFNRMMEL